MKHRKGLTLIELTLSATILIISSGMILSVIVNFARIESQQATKANLNHNALAISQTFNQFIVNGDNIGAGSTLSTHPGTAIIEMPLGATSDVTFDTYTKSVPLGNTTTSIRTLRYTQNSQSYDITDQFTNITNFIAYDRTLSTETQNIEFEIELTTTDPQYSGQSIKLHLSYTLNNS